ncbi:MAG: proline iminopeptidase-family hydrolase [Sphingomonas sp.]
MTELDRRSFLLGSLIVGAVGWEIPGALAAQTTTPAPPLPASSPAPVAPAVVGYAAPDLERMVPVTGGRVYVRVNGKLDSGKPPIVMIHGGPGGTHAHFLTALALADERALVLYDQLDSGQSDRPGDPANWRVDRYVDEVDAIRAALGINRWHVLGHSWGGTVALEYGARQPVGLAGLALASPLISTKSWIADANIRRAELPADVQADIASCDTAPIASAPSATCQRGVGAFYTTFNGRMPATPAATDYSAKHPGGTNQKLYNTMWGSSEFVSTGTLKDYDGEPLLAKLDGKRTLFMGGQYDEARPSTLAGFAARVSGAEFATVPGAAHGIFADRPQETVALIRAWLARQDALA